VVTCSPVKYLFTSGLLVGAFVVAGCASTEVNFGNELLEIRALRDYPFMLSRSVPPGKGQPIRVERLANEELYSSSTRRYTTVRFTRRQSSSGVSTGVASQVVPFARWVQIDNIVFTASDVNSFPGSNYNSTRSVLVEGRSGQ